MVRLGSQAQQNGVVASERTSQLQTLNRLFSRYRQSAMWLSLTGLAIVGAGVLLSYGLRDGARIFAIPCGACLGIFGLFGWSGQSLNLFHLLGAFLGVRWDQWLWFPDGIPASLLHQAAAQLRPPATTYRQNPMG